MLRDPCIVACPCAHISRALKKKKHQYVLPHRRGRYGTKTFIFHKVHSVRSDGGNGTHAPPQPRPPSSGSRIFLALQFNLHHRRAMCTCDGTRLRLVLYYSGCPSSIEVPNDGALGCPFAVMILGSILEDDFINGVVVVAAWPPAARPAMAQSRLYDWQGRLRSHRGCGSC